MTPGREDTFEESFRNRAGQVEQQPGFVLMQILKSDTPHTPFVVLTTWRDRASFEVWLKSEAFEAAHSNCTAGVALKGDGRIEAYGAIITAEAG